MDYTKSVGNITELTCLAKFIELGYECSIPYGDASRYDFVVDKQGTFYRIQCKSCSNPLKKDGERDENVIMFSTQTQTTNTQKTTRHAYTKNEIDFFATCYQGKVYCVPVEECSLSKSLRFAPPSNNQTRYNKAEDYLIEKFFPPTDELLQSKQAFFERNIPNKKVLFCPKCGKNQITRQGNLCVPCSKLLSRKCERPSREELKQLIREKSFTAIAKQYEVSDKAITKWCIDNNLPSRKRDINLLSDEEWKVI